MGINRLAKLSRVLANKARKRKNTLSAVKRMKNHFRGMPLVDWFQKHRCKPVVPFYDANLTFKNHVISKVCNAFTDVITLKEEEPPNGIGTLNAIGDGRHIIINAPLLHRASDLYDVADILVRSDKIEEFIMLFLPEYQPMKSGLEGSSSFYILVVIDAQGTNDGISPHIQNYILSKYQKAFLSLILVVTSNSLFALPSEDDIDLRIDKAQEWLVNLDSPLSGSWDLIRPVLPELIASNQKFHPSVWQGEIRKLEFQQEPVQVLGVKPCFTLMPSEHPVYVRFELTTNESDSVYLVGIKDGNTFTHISDDKDSSRLKDYFRDRSNTVIFVWGQSHLIEPHVANIVIVDPGKSSPFDLICREAGITGIPDSDYHSHLDMNDAIVSNTRSLRALEELISFH